VCGLLVYKKEDFDSYTYLGTSCLWWCFFNILYLFDVVFMGFCR